MNALTVNWVKVGILNDIPVRGSRCIRVGGFTVAIFRTSLEQVFALEDKCPHKNGPLSQGIVHDNCVTCPLHNWVISLASGEAQGADEGKVASFPVKLDGDAILLDMGAIPS